MRAGLFEILITSNQMTQHALTAQSTNGGLMKIGPGGMSTFIEYSLLCFPSQKELDDIFNSAGHALGFLVTTSDEQGMASAYKARDMVINAQRVGVIPPSAASGLFGNGGTPISLSQKLKRHLRR